MVSSEANRIWTRACSHASINDIGAYERRLWFRDVQPLLRNGRTLVLGVDNKLQEDFLTPFLTEIQTAVNETSARRLDVTVEVRPRNGLSEAAPKKEGSGQSFYGQRLNKEYSFDSFVVGSSNELAYTASRSIAEQLTHSYSPLYLYGGSGLGKTHLMHAIGNVLLQNRPDMRIVYVQTEQFVNEFIACISNNKFNDFREKYRRAELLMIDDIQFLEGKERMQEEFFHTFNAVHESGNYVVITCDKPPRSLTTLEDRIRTRLSSGYTIDIQSPDYETRVAILNRLIETSHVHVPEEVTAYIAQNITRNVRELEGAFRTLTAYALLGAPITLAQTERLLKDIVQPGAVRVIDSDLVMDIVARYFGLTTADLISKRRSQDVVLPRQIAMYLCRTKTNMTLEQIGQVFGGRNHATVIHAYDKIRKDRNKDSRMMEQLSQIEERLS